MNYIPLFTILLLLIGTINGFDYSKEVVKTIANNDPHSIEGVSISKEHAVVYYKNDDISKPITDDYIDIFKFNSSTGGWNHEQKFNIPLIGGNTVLYDYNIKMENNVISIIFVRTLSDSLLQKIVMMIHFDGTTWDHKQNIFLLPSASFSIYIEQPNNKLDFVDDRTFIVDNNPLNECSTDSESSCGVTSIYHYDGSNWVHQRDLVGLPNEGFGTSLAWCGNHIISVAGLVEKVNVFKRNDPESYSFLLDHTFTNVTVSSLVCEGDHFAFSSLDTKLVKVYHVDEYTSPAASIPMTESLITPHSSWGSTIAMFGDRIAIIGRQFDNGIVSEPVDGFLVYNFNSTGAHLLRIDEVGHEEFSFIDMSSDTGIIVSSINKQSVEFYTEDGTTIVPRASPTPYPTSSPTTSAPTSAPIDVPTSAPTKKSNDNTIIIVGALVGGLFVVIALVYIYKRKTMYNKVQNATNSRF